MKVSSKIICILFILSFSLNYAYAEDTEIDLSVFAGGLFIDPDRVYEDRCYLLSLFGYALIGNYKEYVNETLWSQNIPIIYLYKNGILTEQVTIQMIDPNMESIRDTFSAGFATYPHNTYLTSGQSANIKIVLDPLNRIPEGKYRNRVKIEDLENNNVAEKQLTCNDISISELPNSCNLTGILAGKNIYTSVKVYNYFYVDKNAPIEISMYLKKWNKTAHLATQTRTVNIDKTEVINLEGKVPLDFPEGNAQLNVSAKTISNYREVNTRNNEISCNINIQRIDDVDINLEAPIELEELKTYTLSWTVSPQGIDRDVWMRTCKPKAKLFYKIQGHGSWNFIYGDLLERFNQITRFGGTVEYTYRWKIPGICRNDELGKQRCQFIDDRDMLPTEIKLEIKCEEADFRDITMDDIEFAHIINIRPGSKVEEIESMIKNMPKEPPPGVDKKKFKTKPEIPQSPPRR
ncbi:MAG: hypothetical protein ABDH16_00020 [Thermodesulfovibrionaceae bacterium]